jgi:hypothetical protein
MRRVYRYKPSWWFGFLSVGILLVAFTIAVVMLNYPDIAAGEMSFSYYLGLLLIISGMLAFGILMLLAPFVTKIVISPQKIEYHAWIGSMESSWESLRYIGVVPYARGIDAEVLLPSEANVYLKPWAKIVPRRIIDDVLGRGIPISWFGGFRSHRLKADIRDFAPHVGV